MARLLPLLIVTLAAGALLVGLLPAGPAAAETVVITMGSDSIYGPFWFCDSSDSGHLCTWTIGVGDTVTWQNTTSVSHTSTECDGSCGATPASSLWDSGLIAPGSGYSRTFDQVGTFYYQCNIHPTQMIGSVVVTSASTTPTPRPTPLNHNGDVNKDDTTNAIDAALILQYSAGYVAQISNGDVNVDGLTNSIDAALVLQYVARLIHGLPV